MGIKISKSTLVNKIYLENTTVITRICLVCQEQFETTVGGPRICKKKSCRKIHNGYMPRIYPAHLPFHRIDIDQVDMEKILSGGQGGEEVEIDEQLEKLLAKREQIKKGGLP